MIPTRPATEADLPQMVALLNEIIAIGGTTAMEETYDVDRMRGHMLTGEDVICCHVALDPAGDVAAFQYVVTSDAGGSIASFARQSDPVKGAGRALFPVTCAAVQAAGVHEIEAKIRADNVPGLAYYSKMGFQDHHIVPAVPLADGTPVDRVVKRIRL
ncbi:MAG: GNAT family N-acetyltransferase [Shimia sp.]